MTTGSRTKGRLARAEQARRTQRSIVEAATSLFLRDGFVTTTMSAIAAEAGVAVQTLYLSFRSKTAILVAAFDVAIAGDDDPTPLLERGWMRQVLEQPKGPRALSGFIEASTRIMSRTTPLYIVIRSAAADPDVAELLVKNKTERHAHFSVFAEALATKPGFTSQLTIKQAADLLYTVHSEDTYAMLVHEQGWTSEAWGDWCLRTMLAEMFPG